MNASKPLALAMLIGMAAFSATAQTAAEHAQHHPDGATAPAQAAPEQQMSAMDKQLQLMRDMSRKLADAKTPQERQAVMAEHQKTMQDSMKMMGQMQGMPMGGMGMMSGPMMMGGTGMPGGSATPPSAAGSTAAPAPDMGPQMMGQMMQRHALMEKRMDMMQAMMQMMMDRMPAP